VKKLSEDKMIFNLDFGKHTAAGGNKLQNEDSVEYYSPQNTEDLFLRGQMFLIADAKGEEQDGKFSSSLVTHTIIQEYFKSSWNGNLTSMLTNAMQKANKAIYQANINKGKQGYYSLSLVCSIIHESTLYLAAIGGCKACLISNDSLQSLIESGKSENENFDLIPGLQPQDVPLPLLGIKDNILIDIKKRKIQINDVILIFTRSVFEAIPEQDLPAIIGTSSFQQACELMVNTAIENNKEDDATVVVFKVKGIKRLSIDEEEKSIEKLSEPDEPAEREIVIKGVRYRSNRKEEPIGEPDTESVDEFSQDRDFRRPVYKRTLPPIVKSSKFPSGKWLNYSIIFLLLFIFVYAVIKYIPPYVQSLKKSPTVQQITPSDTLDFSLTQEQEFVDETQDSVIIPIKEPQLSSQDDTSGLATNEEVEEVPSISIKIALIDGSKKPIALNSFSDELKKLNLTDRLTRVKSSFRIKSSIIIWRKTLDSRKTEAISKRVENLKTMFNRYFQIEPGIKPLDFTIVIGADFNMPNVGDNYTRISDTNNNFYIEILNGYRVAGSARKLGNLLHNQRFDEKKIIVVNYRNADKLNYLHSYLKCDASLTEDAEKFINHFKLSKSVTNAPLFDIKILVGSDVVL
jgi:serine/threonine protein phosphatase PrpC